jgi:hypothetical protein
LSVLAIPNKHLPLSLHFRLYINTPDITSNLITRYLEPYYTLPRTLLYVTSNLITRYLEPNYTLPRTLLRGISWVAEDLLASQEGLCSTELVS